MVPACPATHSTDWGVVIPHFELEWQHEYRGNPDSFRAFFIDDPNGTPIVITGNATDTDYYRFSLGTSFVFPKRPLRVPVMGESAGPYRHYPGHVLTRVPDGVLRDPQTCDPDRPRSRGRGRFEPDSVTVAPHRKGAIARRG